MESHNIARSREGHAAQAGVDKWVLIQENTFRNWVNEQLRSGGLEVENLENDFDDGVRLVALVSSLQGKRIRVIKNARNHHQQLANVAEALTAIANDNIKLVNIGPEDVVDGNLKLILGLIWHLILRYQIGKSRFPTKKLMICWLQAVIPECNITNFTSDWNDGIALHALIEFCQPGLCPEWRNLSRSDGLDNCRNAMMLAKEHFDIPLVVRPEDLSSTDLDELSGMTYLSYFMKVDSPGYHATLSLVRRLLRGGTVNNFTSDWSNGQLLCRLVHAVGGNVPGWPSLSDNPVECMQMGIDGAKGVGIEPILPAKDMADPEVDHIGIMAYAAYFLRFKPVRSASEKVVFSSLPQNSPVDQEASFAISLEDDDVSPGDIRAEIIGPDSVHNVHFNWVGRTGHGYFTPTETGLHRLNVYCEGQVINGCPASFKVLADRSKVTLSAVDSCSLGTLTELQVNSATAGDGDVQIEVRAPSGRSMNLSAVPRHGGNYISNFNPTEVGEWEVSVLYDNDHISGSPYTVNVFDPSQVKVYGLEGGSMESGVVFNADATKAGKGNTRVEIIKDGVDVTRHCIINEEYSNFYKLHFTPPSPGHYNVHVLFNETEVRGSPYDIDIVDSSNVTVSGDGLSLVCVNRTASFEVHGGSSGKLDVEITAPSGSSVPYRIEQGTNEFRVEYIPTEVGDHTIDVKYADSELSGSPFCAKAYNTAAIEVTDLPDGVVGQPIEFGIDVRKAGEGQLEIMVNNGNLPNTVESDATGVYRMSFVPEEPGIQNVEIIFNKESHPRSPFTCNAVNLNQASVRSLDLQLPVEKTSSFYVHSENISQDLNVNVDISSPTGDDVAVRYKKEAHGVQRIDFIPKQAGVHTIQVTYLGVLVGDSPYQVKVYDPRLVRLSKMPLGILNIPFKFRVLADEAGDGKMEVTVETEEGKIPTELEALGEGTFEVTFMGDGERKHTLNILFNGEHIPCSPLSINFADVDKIRIQKPGTMLIPCNRQINLQVTSAPSAIDDLVINVEGPVFNKVPHKFREIGSRLYSLDWTPIKPGTYDIDVKYGDVIPVWGSPMKIKAFDSTRVKLIDKGYMAEVGERHLMKFDVKEAGEGELGVIIMCAGETVQSAVSKGKDDLIWVSFEPEKYELYDVYVTFNKEPIPGSPFKIDLSRDEPDCRALALLNTKYFVVEQLQWCFLQAIGYFFPIDQIVMYITGGKFELASASCIVNESYYNFWHIELAS